MRMLDQLCRDGKGGKDGHVPLLGGRFSHALAFAVPGSALIPTAWLVGRLSSASPGDALRLAACIAVEFEPTSIDHSTSSQTRSKASAGRSCIAVRPVRAQSTCCDAA